VRLDDRPHHFLLVEDNRGIAQVIRQTLAEAYGHAFTLAHVENLADGLDRMRAEYLRAVLLDLFVTDSHGLVTFERVHVAAPHVPILVLCARADEGLAQQAVERGAWEYVLTDELRAASLTQALRRMILHADVEEASYLEPARAQVTLDSIGDAVLCTDNAG